jgi:predicted DNA-binding helix-hairpin-helix protein
MSFRIAPDAIQKLTLLDDATRFEPAGADPLAESQAATGVETAAAGSRRPKPLPCISEVTTPQGKKPILKSMMTTACEKNCFYCPFRAGRAQTQRITFTPDEMASSFDLLQRSGVVDGMFLSSGIIKGGVTAQDKIIDTAEILRKKYSYRGYIHLKVMPGAEYDQIRRAMQLADRVSINLEGPTPERLAALAPKKDYWEEIFPRVQWIAQLREQERLRASVVTQFVVGAVGDTDLELLQLSELLYNQYQLRRAYYSAFHPVSNTPFENL